MDTTLIFWPNTKCENQYEAKVKYHHRKSDLPEFRNKSEILYQIIIITVVYKLKLLVVKFQKFGVIVQTDQLYDPGQARNSDGCSFPTDTSRRPEYWGCALVVSSTFFPFLCVFSLYLDRRKFIMDIVAHDF